ncbi:MAG: four helix bundle protein [Nitrospiraceae bacterium]|nr:MAG: four helix bundle protein [Nitrospiraceae bacterium]
MGKATSFKDLIVWQKAHNLVISIYKMTTLFPAEEKFGLVSQMRRAAVSVPANVAEGFVKRGIKDKCNFYNIAQGSLEELKYYLMLSKDLGYLKENDHVLSEAESIGKLLNRLWSSTLTTDY